VFCKNCMNWSKLQSNPNLGICKNRCGKVTIECKKEENVMVNIITESDFGCKSGEEKI